MLKLFCILVISFFSQSSFADLSCRNIFRNPDPPSLFHDGFTVLHPIELNTQQIREIRSSLLNLSKSGLVTLNPGASKVFGAGDLPFDINSSSKGFTHLLEVARIIENEVARMTNRRVISWGSVRVTWNRSQAILEEAYHVNKQEPFEKSLGPRVWGSERTSLSPEDYVGFKGNEKQGVIVDLTIGQSTGTEVLSANSRKYRAQSLEPIAYSMFNNKGTSDFNAVVSRWSEGQDKAINLRFQFWFAEN